MVNSSLSVVSLNVDGMRDPKRRSLMFDYLNRYEYDIALLQDTRILNNRECMQWNAECRCRGFWSVGTVHSRGVGILIRDPAKFECISFDVDFDGRVCFCDLTFNGTPLRVVNIYAPTVGTDRLNFLSQLDKYLLTRRKVIMGGDFNLVLDIAMDRFGGNPHGSIGQGRI
jgi:exonuclease III